MVQGVGQEDVLLEGANSNSSKAKETSPSVVQTSDAHAGNRDEHDGPTKRLGTDRPKYQIWPVVRKPLPLSNAMPSALSERTLTMSYSSPSLRDPSPIMARRPSLKKSVTGLTGRRKKSIPELGLGPMTTVQETVLDSPTIPGRFPIHERSNSAPGVSWKKPSVADSGLSSIREPNHGTPEAAANPMDRIQPESMPRKSLKRSSSLLLPQDMASLGSMLASGSPGFPMSPTINERTSMDEPADHPPAVPPKSPRMALRLQTKQHAVTHPLPTPNYSASSVGSTPLYSGALELQPSPMTPFSSASSSLQPTPLRTHNTWEGRTSPRPTNHSRSNSRGPEISMTTQTATRQESPKPSFGSEPIANNTSEHTEHKREASETSILDRGRPTKRVEGFVKTKHSFGIEKEDPVGLPPGVSPSDAPYKLDRTEIEDLQRHAVGQAERFQLLNQKDLRILSRELRTLDERCAYLRETHNSLRHGRRNLQTRLITYLKSPRLPMFSRESILKQEEALAELDSSIDEWVGKLEQADLRRARIQERLLQHCAAALTLQTERPDLATSPAFSEDQTPPRSPGTRSPGKNFSPRTPDRRAVESIKIYADSDVYALLADIEQEMDYMVEPKVKIRPSEVEDEMF